MFVGRRLMMNDREMLKNIEAVVEKNVRPALRSHGGDVELLSYTDGICRVRLLGKCSGCPSAFITTEEIIREAIVKELPMVQDVVLVTETSDELMDFAKSLMGRHKA